MNVNDSQSCVQPLLIRCMCGARMNEFIASLLVFLVKKGRRAVPKDMLSRNPLQIELCHPSRGQLAILIKRGGKVREL